MATFARHAAAVTAHRVASVNGRLTAKRWDGPRRPDLLADLAAGRALVELDRAAEPTRGERSGWPRPAHTERRHRRTRRAAGR
jgi:hypothetical protein